MVCSAPPRRRTVVREDWPPVRLQAVAFWVWLELEWLAIFNHLQHCRINQGR
jgi:hypothetical protein